MGRLGYNPIVVRHFSFFIDFATLSTGEKIKSPKPLKAKLKRLRTCQRNLARKPKGSKRREKARLKVAKLHAKVKDTRTDVLHKLSTRLIRENQTVILEDLNPSGMMKNRRLSRAISDLGWHGFRTMLGAKAEMYGGEFRVISRWEPTSQRCSCCGEIGGKKAIQLTLFASSESPGFRWVGGCQHDRTRRMSLA